MDLLWNSNDNSATIYIFTTQKIHHQYAATTIQLHTEGIASRKLMMN
jgi:hypothetical protein